MSKSEVLLDAFEVTGSDSIDAELYLHCICCVFFKSIHFVLCQWIHLTAQEFPIVLDTKTHTQSINVDFKTKRQVR